GVAIVVITGVGSALLAAAIPTSRLCRALATLGTVLFAAFFNSFGNVNHGWHTWLWVSVVLIFLPDGPIESLGARTIRAQRYLSVIWSAQAAKLMFYSMSGCFKLAAAAVQIAHGQVHALAPEALARHTAYHLLEGTALARYTLGPFVIRHPYVGWPFMLLAIYLEAFSLLVAFRPAVHRAWGVALIL